MGDETTNVGREEGLMPEWLEEWGDESARERAQRIRRWVQNSRREIEERREDMRIGDNVKWSDRDSKHIMREVDVRKRREYAKTWEDRGWVRIRWATLIVFLVWAGILGACFGVWITSGGR